MLKKAEPEVLQSLDLVKDEKSMLEERFRRFKYRFGWIVQAIFILCFVILTIYTIRYIHQLTTSPCQLCEEMNYVCTHFTNPAKLLH